MLMARRFRYARISIDEHQKLLRVFKSFSKSFKGSFMHTWPRSDNVDPAVEYLADFLSQKFRIKIAALDIDFINLEEQPQEISTCMYNMTYKLIKNSVMNEILECKYKRAIYANRN